MSRICPVVVEGRHAELLHTNPWGQATVALHGGAAPTGGAPLVGVLGTPCGSPPTTSGGGVDVGEGDGEADGVGEGLGCGSGVPGDESEPPPPQASITASKLVAIVTRPAAPAQA